MDEKSIFNHARNITDPATQEDYLMAKCGDDADALQRIQDLLVANADDSSFLEQPPVDAGRTKSMDQGSRVGERIGPYKLLQEIGEGGMGSVYMAEQTEPVKRRVALKIIKAGMDSKQVIARFAAERQALAMMDHPNIARLLDVGTTDTGRPYFVMELVKGVPITAYCDDKRLNVQQRLDLFTSVCNAVQHAHQKGIIHRDLKPSNILVAEYDDKVVPKIIDFGLAKALDQSLTDMTMFTQLGQVVGTLAYMSPEQSKMNQLDVDTRTDIYSLGVLLYELLSGTTPFDAKRLKSAALDQVLKIIREEQPPKPSTRISSSGNKAASISEQRQIAPGRLRQILKGELDWVVMKALEKERGRRYETANGLAYDIQRYLNNEAVIARPPSVQYKLNKFVTKHKVFVATAVTFLGLLIAGIAGTSIGLYQANSALQRESIATSEAQRSKDEVERKFIEMKDAIDTYFTKVCENPRFKRFPESETVRRELLTLALNYYQQFSREADDNPELKTDIANTYVRIGEIFNELSQPTDALKQYELALAVFDEQLATDPDSFQLLRGKATALKKASHCINVTGNRERALEYSTTAIEIQKKLVKDQPDNMALVRSLGEFENHRGIMLRQTGDRKKTLEHLQNAGTIFKRLLLADPDNIQLRLDLAKNKGDQANILRDLGQLPLSERLTDEVIEELSIIIQSDPTLWEAQYAFSISANQKSIFHLMRREPKQAQNVLNKAEPVIDRLCFIHPDVAKYLHVQLGIISKLAICADSLGDLKFAVKHFKKAMDVTGRLRSIDPNDLESKANYATALVNFGTFLAKHRMDPVQAKEHVESALTIWQELENNQNNNVAFQLGVASSSTTLAGLERENQQYKQALEKVNEAISMLAKIESIHENNPKVKYHRQAAYSQRANLLVDLEKYGDAVSDFRLVIKFSPPPQVPSVQIQLALALARDSKFGEARQTAAVAAKSPRLTPKDLFRMGRVHAVIATRMSAEKPDQQQAVEQIEMAIDFLQKSVIRGRYASRKALTDLKQSADFNALRKQQKFDKIVIALTAAIETDSP